MPSLTTTRQHSSGRLAAPGKALGAVFLTLGLMAATSCTPPPAPEPVADPVKLLQNVRVGLSPAAAVETVEGTTISVSASGASSSADTTYDSAKVVGELPVRVSLQYRAGKKSGSDLADLKGHTGKVEIDLTLENLTVRPRALEYDAAGQTRTDTALVGAPLTIAASTKLTGVEVDDVTAGTPDGAKGTNGVLSSAKDGAAVVQWATVLAPPQSGASTTLRLVAQVKDFQVPAIEVAVQPGLNTDLSADGVLAGAFSSGSGSELELQRRTIALVSDVNTVLVKAGSTITEVRDNLEVTSETLGVETAGELRDNSQALAATMAGLKEQLTTLGTDLEAATTSTQSTTASQLKQTVAAVDAMLGDTTAVPAPAPITGDGCTAEVPKPGTSATVYSSILTMASQLDAYAKVSEGCRDTVAGAIQATMGPEEPTAEECAQQGSMTCSLYGSAVTITGALHGLVEKGDEIVAGLQPQVIEGAIEDHDASAAALAKVRSDVAAILTGADSNEEYATALAGVNAAIDSSRASAKATRDAAGVVRGRIDGLLIEIRGTAEGARSELGDSPLDGPPLGGSMLDQNQQLAKELCELARAGRLSDAEADQLRSYLTSTPCKATDDIGNPLPGLTPPFGFNKPMDMRLQAQATAWDSVLTATNATAEGQDINSALTALDEAVDEIDGNLTSVTEAVKALDRAATGKLKGTKGQIEALDAVLGQAVDSSGRLGATLAELKAQQDGLGEKITQSLEDVSAETAAEVHKTVEGQVREVTEIGDAGSDAVITAFNRSISGLTSTSDDVVNDAAGTVDKQRNELHSQGDALAASLDRSTQSSLTNIAAGTSGSTRDVEGASALLASSLNKVMLDLGDRSVNGSGLLGSMATSAAKADTADFQLALASQNAEGYANIRSQDVAGLLLRQAQFKASLTAVDELPAFHLKVPAGATSQTLYTLKIGGTP